MATFIEELLMASFNLFNKKRRPEILESIERPDEVLQLGLVFDGGTIFASGTLQIDASMRNTKVISKDGRPICVSALGRLLDCVIVGTDVIIEGDFAGDIEATGDVEITNTAQARGLVKYGGELQIGLMVDRSAIKLQRMTQAADVVGLGQALDAMNDTVHTVAGAKDM